MTPNRDQSHDPLPDVDEVLDGPTNLLDPEVEPVPKLCTGCGKDYGWSWWPGRGRIAGRWCPPPIPCPVCQFSGEREKAHTDLNRLQERAGIAVAHRPYRWDLRGDQEPGETWSAFARSIRLQPGRIGVATSDLAAARSISHWRPGHGGVWLSGPVGSGKSLWLSAVLTGLLLPTPVERITLDARQQERLGVNGDRARRAVAVGCNVWVRGGSPTAADLQVVDEEEIVRRVGLSWKGDPVPLLGIARAQVLVYDDVGSVLLAGGKGADLARTCLDRLVDLRWRESRPLLCTSNRSLDEVCESVSARTASRLRALIDHEHELRGIPVELVERGFSWRRIP